MTTDKTLHQDMALVMKANHKLQSELKAKNETINSLISQNFSELQELKDRHSELVRELTENYQSNITTCHTKYQTFRSSLETKMQDMIMAYSQAAQDRAQILLRHNQYLRHKLDKLYTQRQTLMQKSETDAQEIIKILTEKSNIRQDFGALEIVLQETQSTLAVRNALIESQESEIESIRNENLSLTTHISELNAQIMTSDTKISTLTTESERLTHQNDLQRQELDTLKAKNTELQNHQLMLVTDNGNKQNLLDERQIEALILNNKVTENEKKNIALENNRRDLNLKINDCMLQIDTLKTDLMTAQKTINQMKSEKEFIVDEKYQHMQQNKELRDQLETLHAEICSKIKNIQDTNRQEREAIVHDYETRIQDMTMRHDRQLMSKCNDYATEITSKDKTIDALTSHLKSLNDNQYVVLGELERLKSQAEKVKMDKFGIDQKIAEINSQHQKDIITLKTQHQRERDEILRASNDSLEKLQDANTDLQTRINQLIETLSLAKSNISSIVEEKKRLENNLHERESSDSNLQEMYNEAKADNIEIRNKMDRLSFINNEQTLKIQQQDIAIKKLKNSCKKLMLELKRNQDGISSDTNM